jgi:hypothetical protein
LQAVVFSLLLNYQISWFGREPRKMNYKSCFVYNYDFSNPLIDLTIGNSQDPKFLNIYISKIELTIGKTQVDPKYLQNSLFK